LGRVIQVSGLPTADDHAPRRELSVKTIAPGLPPKAGALYFRAMLSPCDMAVQ
jgi:hypothetical protein